MKKLILMLTVGILMAATFAFKKSDSPKLIAVIMKANWCPVCQANGQRMGTEVMPAFKDNTKMQFLPNDLTDEKTKKESKVALEKFGLYKTISKETGTGQLILVDAKTKKVLKKISLAEPTAKVISEINSVL